FPSCPTCLENLGLLRAAHRGKFRSSCALLICPDPQTNTDVNEIRLRPTANLHSHGVWGSRLVSGTPTGWESAVMRPPVSHRRGARWGGITSARLGPRSVRPRLLFRRIHRDIVPLSHARFIFTEVVTCPPQR